MIYAFYFISLLFWFTASAEPSRLLVDTADILLLLTITDRMVVLPHFSNSRHHAQQQNASMYSVGVENTDFQPIASASQRNIAMTIDNLEGLSHLIIVMILNNRRIIATEAEEISQPEADIARGSINDYHWYWYHWYYWQYCRREFRHYWH